MATKADSLPERTPDKVIKKYTAVAQWGLVPLFSQIFVMFGPYSWMWWPKCFFFSVWSVGFPVALILFVVYSAVVESKGFRELFDDNEEDWSGLANDARNLILPQIENGNPTVDDIKLVLMPLIDLHGLYRTFLEKHPKLKEKYWVVHFTDYALHRVYNPTLTVPGEQNE